jgi:hypothetical protein
MLELMPGDEIYISPDGPAENTAILYPNSSRGMPITVMLKFPNGKEIWLEHYNAMIDCNFRGIAFMDHSKETIGFVIKKNMVAMSFIDNVTMQKIVLEKAPADSLK